MAITLARGKVVKIDTLTFDFSEDNNATDYMSADQYGQFDSISIVGPAGAMQGTITLAALDDFASDETADASWRTVQSPPGTDITIATDKVTVLTNLPLIAIRLESDGAENADRVFTVYGHLS